MLEIELRGIPTAYIAARGRVPVVKRTKGGFRLTHRVDAGFAEDWNDCGQQSDSLQRSLIHFGIHRVMRLGGVKEGDRVRMGGKEVQWEYPREEMEARIKLSGTGAWSSKLDGIIGYRSVDLTAADRAPVEGDLFDECVALAVPQVVSILTGRD